MWHLSVTDELALPHVINTSKNLKKNTHRGIDLKSEVEVEKTWKMSKSYPFVQSVQNVQGMKGLQEVRGWCAVLEMCSLSADP